MVLQCDQTVLNIVTCGIFNGSQSKVKTSIKLILIISKIELYYILFLDLFNDRLQLVKKQG